MTLKASPDDVYRKFVHNIGAGYVPAGMNTWAAPVDGMLTEQFTRFKSYVENGGSDSKPTQK